MNGRVMNYSEIMQFGMDHTVARTGRSELKLKKQCVEELNAQ